VDGVLYAGSDVGKVYALLSESGEFVWSFQTHGRIKSSPALDAGKVYIGSYDGGLYAINAQSGHMEWIYQTGDIINSSPCVSNGTVYLGPDDTWIYAIDAAEGFIKWKFQVEEESKSALKYGLRNESGISTFGFLPSTPAFDNGMIIVGSNGGNSQCKVYALDEMTGELKWR
jgi:outer membrane protein assembly factor BamB